VSVAPTRFRHTNPLMAKHRLSIMIVDDNDMMRSILRGMLRGELYDVIGEARNGQSAVEMAERLKPDIICMDVLMPELDGIGAMAQIKAQRAESTFIMITANADPETVQQAIENGASGFIIKPFNAARVLDTLEKVGSKLKRKPG